MAKRGNTTRATTTTTEERPEAALKASIDAAALALVEELKAGKSERLTSYLTFAARFHKYSVGNQLLIALQRPEASRVAGYRTWEQMGYHVAKGEKGIRILAPRPYVRRAREESAWAEQTDEGVTRTRERQEVIGLRFVSVAVFDVSQLNVEELEAKPLPEFFTDLGADAETETLATRLTEAMRASGLEVGESDRLPAGAQGVSMGGRVLLLPGLSSRNRVRTLTHEWGHELLHQGESAPAGRGLEVRVKECHAEAVSYTVLAHFGIRNDWSSDYLTSWGATPELLMAELGLVQKAAATIIDALESVKEPKQA